MNKYVPGQCNIGAYEAEKRLRMGIFGIIFAAGFSYIFYIIPSDKFIVFVTLFFGIFIGSLGILQYYNKFCVYYGLMQVFNFESFTKVSKINDLNSAEKDKHKAFKLIIISSIAAFVYAFLYVVLV